MSARPITGWAFARTGEAPVWSELSPSFPDAGESEPVLDESIARACDRWGRSRVAAIMTGDTWPQQTARPRHVAPALTYSKLGPRADEEALGSAWAMIERDIADAVLVRAERQSLVATVLLERAGVSTVQLRDGGSRPVDLALRPADMHSVYALTIAVAAIDRGIACAEADGEPERVGISLADAAWTVEIRI